MKTLVSALALVATTASMASAWTDAELQALAEGIHAGDIDVSTFVNTGWK